MNRWDDYFLRLAVEAARMSKDPNTKVGAVIVGPDREIRATGFNGFPRGIADSPERLGDRDLKLRLIVHAEMNAILGAARVGTPVKGCTLYLAATDDSGAVWGGPPCTRCTVEAIQAGIAEIVSRPRKAVPSRWHADLESARGLIDEAGIVYREVAEDAGNASRPGGRKPNAPEMHEDPPAAERDEAAEWADRVAREYAESFPADSVIGNFAREYLKLRERTRKPATPARHGEGPSGGYATGIYAPPKGGAF